MKHCLSCGKKFNLLENEGLKPLLLKVREPNRIKVLSRDNSQFFVIVQDQNIFHKKKMVPHLDVGVSAKSKKIEITI